MTHKIKLDKALFAQRKNELEAAKTALKQYFIGIDNIIDELIDCIQVWYLMPELLRRPIIVNLWGMTGVGKTDLVRRLVKALNFQDRFAEVELSNTGTTGWNSAVMQSLEDQRLNDGKPSVVLFDEIQRFNSIDSKGEPVLTTKFTDFWELLSDGHLSRKDREDLDSFMYDYAQKKKLKANKKSKENDADEEGIYTLDSWQALRLRKALKLEVPLEEMLNISEEEMVSMIMAAKAKKAIYEPIDHSKTLIIISGNLDDAFSMADQASEADVDADIFHAFTTKITVMNIKDALMRKFRPEQVARFGNIHLIYPSLTKAHFSELIEREITRVKNDIFARTGVKLNIDDSIKSLIYRNGVFPVQGVRPVFSSVTDILEVHATKLILRALSEDCDEIDITYCEETKSLTAKIGEELAQYPYVGRIDKIRQSNSADATANISVHEAGHAIAYMVLFGLVPLQLQSRVASSYAAGFTFPHQIHLTRHSMLDMIKVYLAGGLAEEIQFGYSEASTGRASDRYRATELAIDYVRKFGFDDEFQATYSIENYEYRMDMKVTDTDVEKLMMRLVSETKELLGENKGLLHELSSVLAKTGKLETQKVLEIAANYKINAKIESEGYLHIKNYAKSLN